MFSRDGQSTHRRRLLRQLVIQLENGCPGPLPKKMRVERALRLASSDPDSDPGDLRLQFLWNRLGVPAARMVGAAEKRARLAADLDHHLAAAHIAVDIDRRTGDDGVSRE